MNVIGESPDSYDWPNVDDFECCSDSDDSVDDAIERVDDASIIKYKLEKKRATHRDAFEMIKALLFIPDEQMTKILGIWRRLRPVEGW